MRDFDDDVADFHEKFGHDCPARPTLPRSDVLEFRIKLIREECEELCEAILARDLGRIANEGVDLLYVVLGTFVVCGLIVRPFWDLVHLANMSKEPNPDGGKPLKPEGWEKPDCGSLIDRYQIEDLDFPVTTRDDWPMDRLCGDEV